MKDLTLVFFQSWLLIFLSVVSVSMLSSCGWNSDRPIPKAQHVMFEWNDFVGPGEVNVEINLTTQKAVVRRGKTPIGWCFVATGREGKGTPAGQYRVQEKLVEKYSNKYGWVEDQWGNVTNSDAKPDTPLKPGEVYCPALMPYWHRLTSYGIGMHVGYIPEPGRPASHGCIRLPRDFSPLLYEVTKVGTPVKIVYAKNQSSIVQQ